MFAAVSIILCEDAQIKDEMSVPEKIWTRRERLKRMPKQILVIAFPMLLAASPEPLLGPVRIQLYYKTSGTLSANVAAPAKLSFWNTGAGEGDVKEPAEDMLVSVPITMPPGGDISEGSTVQLVLAVRTKAGKLLATRRYDYISIPYRDPVWSALWVNNIQCAGAVVATAVWGKQKRAATVSFDCGE